VCVCLLQCNILKLYSLYIICIIDQVWSVVTPNLIFIQKNPHRKRTHKLKIWFLWRRVPNVPIIFLYAIMIYERKFVLKFVIFTDMLNTIYGTFGYQFLWNCGEKNLKVMKKIYLNHQNKKRKIRLYVSYQPLICGSIVWRKFSFI
jgi:hypothetical protein